MRRWQTSCCNPLPHAIWAFHNHRPRIFFRAACPLCNSDNADEIDLLAYWRMLAKRRWLIASLVAAGAAIALAGVLLATLPSGKTTPPAP